MEGPNRELTHRLRALWPATLILNPFTYPEAAGPDALNLIEDGTADLVAYGQPLIPSPSAPAPVTLIRSAAGPAGAAPAACGEVTSSSPHTIASPPDLTRAPLVSVDRLCTQ
ncbi:hypothetical protein [Paractinoplanes rishiriensis]|uniref:Uncharacterized protein n=1 Tax=Paractinoplanes rishiriensis TaxID=1050105 RepID=A0A919KB03_9ACTN|nr:hypothetical protein [Actinoplanes rishiriensis]GIF02161.1 hypothetical protein Ari01nite_96250 [Actinoplanes rishiriensis]